jgi:hypothetical protein
MYACKAREYQHSDRGAHMHVDILTLEKQNLMSRDPNFCPGPTAMGIDA